MRPPCNEYADFLQLDMKSIRFLIQACANCFSQYLSLLQLVEDMCLHRMAGQLYGKLQQECDAHISAQLARLAADQTMDPVLALEKVSRSPSWHSATPLST